MTDETVIIKLAKTCNYENTLDEKIVLLESNSSFLLQELHNKEIIIEKLLDNILSNSDKVKTVKHVSEKSKTNGRASRKATRKIS